MPIGALPRPTWISSRGVVKRLDIEVTDGPGIMDITLHLTSAESGREFGTLVVNKFWLDTGGKTDG